MWLVSPQEGESEWKEKKGKKKKQAPEKSESETVPQQNKSRVEVNETPAERDSNDYSSGPYDGRSNSSSRGRRNDRAPPRFQRGRALRQH